MKKYSDQKNIQILISLLKQNGIKKVIASPGSANSLFVGSLQNDDFFEIYSVVDERSAAYIACGLSVESSEPVVITCTGATASRNYLPGLTEAFYRKIPILAVTATQPTSRIGQLVPQVIDRSSMPKDTIKLSVTLPAIKDDEDLWECEIKANSAIQELFRHEGGPVHINLINHGSQYFDCELLPNVRNIVRFFSTNNSPEINQTQRNAIFIGSHNKFSVVEQKNIESFCEKYNAVVLCDHTSNYNGKYKLNFSIVAGQILNNKSIYRPDLLIHIGEISGDYYTTSLSGKKVWRVSTDGEIRDPFRKLEYVFEMTENSFFHSYASRLVNQKENVDSYYDELSTVISNIKLKIPELPFSNIWVASQLSTKLPENSTIHFGILNSLRAWNFFPISNTISGSCNVGGFGIDGCVSSLIGASFSDGEKLFFGVFGDLAFFYDLNCLGIRHIQPNIRILLVNNGIGSEFTNFNIQTSKFGKRTEDYIAAGGHYGNKSNTLVRDYCKNLGFKYLFANNKKEFAQVADEFVSPIISENPILLEVFTDSIEESNALELLLNLETTTTGEAKKIIKNIFGEKNIQLLKEKINRK